MEALLLSNSTNFGESYMEWCHDVIAEFIGTVEGKLVFIPFAAVNFSYEQYTEQVNKALTSHNLDVVNIAQEEDPVKTIQEADVILVGGGNTFHLLKTMQDKGLIAPIQEAIKMGCKYIGWSAGSNVAGMNIKTTNDMPIVEPATFDALNIVPFVINPHYTEKTIPNHGGESRQQRLEEFIAVNAHVPILCLPEGSYCLVHEGKTNYRGKTNGFWMTDMGQTELTDGHLI